MLTTLSGNIASIYTDLTLIPFEATYCKLLSLPETARNRILHSAEFEEAGGQGGYEDFYRHLTFELLGDLTSSPRKYLPMLPNLKNIKLSAHKIYGPILPSFQIMMSELPFIGRTFSESPYFGTSEKYRLWGRAVLIGLFEALYKRSMMPEATAIDELALSVIDARALFLTPDIVARAMKGIEQLKTVSLDLDSDEVDGQWLFLVGHLLSVVKGLRELEIVGFGGEGVLKFWELVTPYEYYYNNSLKITDITASMLRNWPHLTILTVKDICFWSDIILCFLERHKGNLTGHLIDRYSGYLDVMFLDRDSTPEPEDKAEKGSLEKYKVSNENNNMHQAETDVWVAWIMGKRSMEPAMEEMTHLQCHWSNCELCSKLSRKDNILEFRRLWENEGASEDEGISEDEDITGDEDVPEGEDSVVISVTTPSFLCYG
ncbi:hypothetical protein K440DRAFT_645344 [Wilcoxina mikolae CBS 423.85]|nr:hypothetical protein K440DRAFT_645344 [Wilcoxina mikolae CBS 423.85]